MNTETSLKTVKIDGVEYNVADLSEEVKIQMINLKVTNEEIVRLNQLVSITKTAHATYSKALNEELAKLNLKPNA